MNIKWFKIKNSTITLTFYWLLLLVNVLVSKLLNLPNIVEWWMNTAVFLVLILLFIFTYRTDLNIYYRLLIVPLSWIIHAILTIPAATVLGILMYDPNHVRTSGEHRAVFILASIPIILFMMNKSRLYQNELMN